MAWLVGLDYLSGLPMFEFEDEPPRGAPRANFGMSAGQPIDPTWVPSRAREKTHRKIVDLFPMPGLNAVNQRFRDLVEEFEPGVHQFFPLGLFRKDGSRVEDNYYVFNCTVSIDTLLVSRSEVSWSTVRGTDKPYVVTAGERRWVLSRPAIGARHIWCGARISTPCTGILVSDAFHDALVRRKIRYIRARTHCEEVDEPWLAEENIKRQLDWEAEQAARPPTPDQQTQPTRTFAALPALAANASRADTFDAYDWIKLQRPEVWHVVAKHWNWDDGIEVLDWIVSQPQCDAGTARSIFWLCYLGDSAVADLTSDVREEVATRGVGTTQELFEKIGWNAHNELYRTNDLSADHSESAEKWGPELTQALRKLRDNGTIEWGLAPTLLRGGDRMFQQGEFTGKEVEEMTRTVGAHLSWPA
jgi:hypothetical protein